jgi:hypothetical protein
MKMNDNKEHVHFIVFSGNFFSKNHQCRPTAANALFFSG